MASWQPGFVSVVIPTYNRIDTLLRVLDGFTVQSLPSERYEVIVVDDGSEDGTPERLSSYSSTCPYSLVVLEQANAGPAAARNTGLARARGDIVIFIDDDCIPEPRLIEEHRASHQVEGLAVIGKIGWHPDLPDAPFDRFVREHTFAYFFITLPFDAPFACFYTGNASVHRATAQAIGGFDEDFRHAMHEDIEFGYRLRQHGVRFIFNDRAVVLHYRTSDFASSLRRELVNGREAVRLWSKHPELGAMLPVEQMIDPDVQQRFYEVVTTYYQRLGVQEALDTISQYDPSETLPEQFEEQARRWADQRVETLQAELSRLRSELTRLHQMRQADLEWTERMQQEHEALQAAFQEQSAWAADLASQLETRRPQGPIGWLVEKLPETPRSSPVSRALRRSRDNQRDSSSRSARSND